MKGYERENEDYRLSRVHEVCFKDLTGKKFNKLTVIGVDHKRGKSYYWKCKCDCGNETVVYGGALVSGHTKSCGCAHKKALLKDLTGMVFGRLTVIGYSHKEGKRHFWKCICSCDGKELVVAGDLLRGGSTKSCGCIKIERCKAKKPKEDLTGKVFGDLTVESYIKHSYWKCKCKCGNERIVHSMLLKNGSVTKCKECTDSHCGYSLAEKDLLDKISKITNNLIVENDRKVLGSLEIDIYIPKLKIGIEYCGSPFHASENGIYRNLPKTYHRDKFLLAKSKGVHLITVFDIDYENNASRIIDYIKDVINGEAIHNKPDSNIVYTNNDYDCGDWLEEFGYEYDGQEEIPYYIYRDRFKVFRSGISRWKKSISANIELTK